jgi:hypothetical protein
MDQVDLIDDVYTKGETLLNTVSDPVKTKLENQLAEFENDWAEFCGSVTECSNKIKEELKRQQTLNDWKEFNENSEAITTKLKHFESLLSEEVPVVNSLDDVSEMLLKIQVYFLNRSRPIYCIVSKFNFGSVFLALCLIDH